MISTGATLHVADIFSSWIRAQSEPAPACCHANNPDLGIACSGEVEYISEWRNEDGDEVFDWVCEAHLEYLRSLD